MIFEVIVHNLSRNYRLSPKSKAWLKRQARFQDPHQFFRLGPMSFNEHMQRVKENYLLTMSKAGQTGEYTATFYLEQRLILLSVYHTYEF